MNVEHQGPYECMLATIAALQGRPLADVRREACQFARVRKWSSLFSSLTPEKVGRFWTAVSKITEDTPNLQKTVLSTRIFNLCGASGSIPAIPATGRGVVHLWQYMAGVAHIMPWENGLVYDPDGPGEGQLLSDLIPRRYPGDDIAVKILTLPEAEKNADP